MAHDKTPAPTARHTPAQAQANAAAPLDDAAQQAPFSLDTHHVTNWQSDARAAMLDPAAGLHAQLAWLWGEVCDIKELLWAYIIIEDNIDGSKAPAMAHALCHFIEGRTTTMRALLDKLCVEANDAEMAARHTKGGAA